MWLWWFLFACNVMVPVIQMSAGRMMWKHCPQKINSVYGYRTSRSMKNQDTWKFAHDHCGRVWWKIGWIMLILSVVVQIPFYHSSEEVIGKVSAILCTLQLIALIASIFPTEYALKKEFLEDGSRREG